MTLFQNECVSCEDCRHCGNDRIPHVACDECGTIDSETEEGFFSYDGEDLCLRCLLSKLIEDHVIREVTEP